MLSALQKLPPDVETPALVVDEAALLQNISAMAASAEFGGSFAQASRENPQVH